MNNSKKEICKKIEGASKLKSFSAKGLAIFVFVLLVVCQAVIADDFFDYEVGAIGKRESINSMADELLEVGIIQYDSALFDSAEVSLLKAQRLKKYLDGGQTAKLNKYLRLAAVSKVKREVMVKHIHAADERVKEGKLIRAKAHLMAIEGSDLLTAREHKLINESLKKVNKWLKEQEAQTKTTYNDSIKYYKQGHMENARKGFMTVSRSGLVSFSDGKTAEDYIHQIDALVGKSGRSNLLTDRELFAIDKGPEDITSQARLLGNKADVRKSLLMDTQMTNEQNYIQAINKKRSLVQGYVKAVVKDSQLKAMGLKDTGKFYEAQKELDRAKKSINDNRLYLDDAEVEKYTSSIGELEGQIKAQRQNWIGSVDGFGLEL